MAEDDDLALVRRLAPEVLAMLLRRYGHFDACEDAVQEALVAASVQWPAEGRPASPKAWLMTVASRRLIDELRSDEARRRREQSDASMAGSEAVTGPAADDTLTLLFLCCHPALLAPSQLALTLRAVAGLTTAEIARAFLVPEATMAQRISRAKQKIVEAGASFRPPPEAECAGRLRVVLHVLYLLFNEGYTATSGPDLVRTDLTSEAIRLTRELLRVVPDDGEVAGLLALMLLTDARRAARTDRDGGIVPLTEQDRTLWDADEIAEGVALVTGSLASKPLGPYQVQAAIAAVHDEAERVEDTDWRQILALYGVLQRIAPGPMVALNRAVALAMVEGPEAGLDALDALDAISVDDRVETSHRLESVRAHLLEMNGDTEAARNAYVDAARRGSASPSVATSYPAPRGCQLRRVVSRDAGGEPQESRSVSFGASSRVSGSRRPASWSITILTAIAQRACPGTSIDDSRTGWPKATSDGHTPRIERSSGTRLPLDCGDRRWCAPIRVSSRRRRPRGRSQLEAVMGHVSRREAGVGRRSGRCRGG